MSPERDHPARTVPRHLLFDEYVVDTVERQLYRGDEPLHLTPRAFDLLLVFLRRSTELLTREELLEEVWPERIVEDSNLTQTVFLLRKILGDDGDARRFIVTEPGRGYRFVREVRTAESVESPMSGDPDEELPSRVAVRRSAALWALGASLALLVLFLLVTAQIQDRSSPVEFSSVAVLPFVDLATNEPSPLGLGFADAVASGLSSSIPGLDVRRAPSVIDSVGAQARPEQIGERLGVESLIHGSVIRLEDDLHVSVQLTETREGETVWGASFQHSDGDLLEFQKLVADRMVRAFTSGARHFERVAAEDLGGTDNPVAYEQMMEGQFHLTKRSARGTELAREAFAAALEADPVYGEAWAELSAAELLLVFYGTGDATARERCDRARNAALRALEIRPTLAAPSTTLGMIELHCRYDFEAAERYFRQGIRLDPNSSRAHHWYSLFFSAMGEHERARSFLETAHELDPMSLIIRSSMVGDAYARGDYEEALRLTYSTLAIDPNFGRAHLVRGLVLEAMGRYEEARASLRTAEEILGPGDEVRAAMTHLETLREEDSSVIEGSMREIRSPMHRAIAMAARDDAAAIELLLEAIAERELWVWQLWTDPRLGSVRAHPDFHRVEEALGLRYVPPAGNGFSAGSG